MINYPRFVNAIHLMLNVYQNSSSSLLSFVCRLIDITKLMKITLNISNIPTITEDLFINVVLCIEQASNLSSLSICGCYRDTQTCPNTFNIYSILPRQLKHLEIGIDSLNVVEEILTRCNNLSTVRFDGESLLMKEITQWFVNNTINSICWRNNNQSIRMWLGKKSKSN